MFLPNFLDTHTHSYAHAHIDTLFHTYAHTHTHTHTHIYIYGEIVDFGESDKMIKISGRVDKSSTYNGFCGNISFFTNRRTSSIDEVFC